MTSSGDRISTDIREALRASEERYRFLTETLPVQIWTSQPDGQLDYVTEQTARSFGLSAADLLRDGWKDVLHPDDVPKAVERWTHALTTGEVYEVEFRLKLANGTYAWHLARAVPQRGADGHILQWCGTNTNIQEQREEQRRVSALLEEVVRQAKESEAALRSLRDASTQAAERIRELEAKLATR